MKSLISFTYLSTVSVMIVLLTVFKVKGVMFFN